MLRSRLAVFTALSLTLGGATPIGADELPKTPARAQPAAPPGPSLRTDLLVVGSVTGVFSLLNPDVRSGVLRDGSLKRVGLNFASPIRRARQGGREDTDPFLTNYVAHPVSWGLLGMYLKERGYSNLAALTFSQLHSITWEYVIEGSYQKPSGKDIVTNFTSSALAIFALHGFSERAAQRESKRPHDWVLALLNPLRPLRAVLSPESDIALAPIQNDGALGLALSISF